MNNGISRLLCSSWSRSWFASTAGIPGRGVPLRSGRDEQRMAAAGKQLGVRARTLRFDAIALDSHETPVVTATWSSPTRSPAGPPGRRWPRQHRRAVLDRCGPAPPGQLRVRGGQVRPGRLRPRAGRLAARQRGAGAVGPAGLRDRPDDGRPGPGPAGHHTGRRGCRLRRAGGTAPGGRCRCPRCGPGSGGRGSRSHASWPSGR
jgi:hypothetical protein